MNKWEKCSKGDVVLLDNGTLSFVGEVQWHIALEGDAALHTMSLVSKWEQLEKGARFTKWKRSHQLVLCKTCEIAAALIWAESDGVVTVLLPLGVQV